jgi:hypothetical protein
MNPVENNLLTTIQCNVTATKEVVKALKCFRRNLGIYVETDDDDAKEACAKNCEDPVSKPSFIEIWDTMPDILYKISGDIYREIKTIGNHLIKNEYTEEECTSKTAPSDHIGKIQEGIRALENALFLLDEFANKLMSGGKVGGVDKVNNPETIPSFRNIWTRLPNLFENAIKTIEASIAVMTQAIYDESACAQAIDVKWKSD